MAKSAARFSYRKIVQEVLAQITWYHNIALMDKVKTAEEHIWYANATVKNGWSRNVLAQESGFLYQKQYFLCRQKVQKPGWTLLMFLPITCYTMQ